METQDQVISIAWAVERDRVTLKPWEQEIVDRGLRDHHPEIRECAAAGDIIGVFALVEVCYGDADYGFAVLASTGDDISAAEFRAELGGKLERNA